MTTNSQRPKGRENAVSLLNAAIDAMDLAEKISSITPAKAVFATVSVILTMIKVPSSSSAMRCSELTRNKDSMINASDYVELGLFCADICRALDRGMNGRKLDDLNRSVCDAISQLTT